MVRQRQRPARRLKAASHEQSLLDDDACTTLWLAAVAAYDDSSANPSPDFASVRAVRSTLAASSLVDVAGFDAALAAVLQARSATSEDALLDYGQFCSLLAVLLPANSPPPRRDVYDIDGWG